MTSIAQIHITTAASYERVWMRMQGQSGFSLAAQAKDAAQYAAERGWQLPEHLRFRDGEDRHASGADWDLPGLNAIDRRGQETRALRLSQSNAESLHEALN